MSQAIQSGDVGGWKRKATSPKSWHSHRCIRQIPSTTPTRQGGRKMTHTLVRFKPPQLRTSWFNHPNPRPRAPAGFTPPCACTFRELELPSPIPDKSRVCVTSPPASAKSLPEGSGNGQRQRKDSNDRKDEKLIAD